MAFQCRSNSDSAGVLKLLFSGRIILGLVVGKTLGVSVATWIAVRSGISSLPRGVNWNQIVAVSMLAGIGFTVALFITGLAFEGDELAVLDTQARMGILIASLVASIIGIVMLARATKPLDDSAK